MLDSAIDIHVVAVPTMYPSLMMLNAVCDDAHTHCPSNSPGRYASLPE